MRSGRRDSFLSEDEIDRYFEAGDRLRHEHLAARQLHLVAIFGDERMGILCDRLIFYINQLTMRFMIPH